MKRADGIFYDGRWGYAFKGSVVTKHKTQDEAARAFIEAYIKANPKYKPLVEGKPWRDVFRVFGISVN